MKDEHKPVISEKMKDQQIKNIISPSSIWGKSPPHADAAALGNGVVIVSGALPK